MSYNISLSEINNNYASSMSSTNTKKKITEIGENNSIETKYEEANNSFISNKSNSILVPTYSKLLENSGTTGQEAAGLIYNAVKQSQSAAAEEEKSENLTEGLLSTINENSPAFNNNTTISTDNTSSNVYNDTEYTVFQNNSDYINAKNTYNDTIDSIGEFSSKFYNKLTGKNVSPETASNKVRAALDGTGKGITSAISAITSGITTGSENALALTKQLNNVMLGIAEQIDMTSVPESAESFYGTLGSILETMANVTTTYVDGVSETAYGQSVESNWKSFINNLNGKLLNTTPLDSSTGRTTLYGNMMLNSPFLFGERSDPRNRTLINSLIKDGRYVSFTPGLPKYNGSSYNASSNDKFDNQTKSQKDMENYLKMNGLTSTFANKDKRYYTFKTDYETYYAYLQAMLNTIWVKMGLGKENGKLNLFNFFGKSGSSLEERYKSSIGFFTNIAGTVSESIDNQITGIGSELSGEINANSDDYQRINYITGMGGGSAFQNAMRQVGNTVTAANQLGNKLSSAFSGTISAANTAIHTSAEDLVMKIANYVKIPIAFGKDVMEFTNTQDLGAVIQSFAVSNGMKVMYPELWSNSSYSKNVNFSFSFTSPYGDPLSIFKYVYTPFCALACLAMPRQAAENGYISPMFVRADVPGLMTSDLALISSFSYTKGGSQSLWTKDGLPRIIDVNITLTDLYPYLSMVKHVSALSSNPSYAVFLDNMSGLMALNDNTNEDALNKYFDALLTRITGTSDEFNDWNKFHSIKNKRIKNLGDKTRASISATVDPYAAPWLHNSSL